MLSGGDVSGDSFQGMGPGFVSPNLDRDLLDGVEVVDVEAAEAECRRLADEHDVDPGACPGTDNDVGILGESPSTREPIPDECPLVVTVFWDSGERYMSTGMFDEE